MGRRSYPLLLLFVLAACDDGSGEPALDEGEWYPGGDATNTKLLGRNAFSLPAPNLSPEHEEQFYSGNSFFNQSWVQAPSSTMARDGVGPLFNARACSGCHLHDGKGAPPDSGTAPFVGVLLRLSVPGPDGAPVPDPVYGGQLQDQANPGVPVEAVPSIAWEEIAGSYGDGTPWSLVRPRYTISDPSHGPLPPDLMVSPRVAPHMIGLGLLEAIPAARLEQLADPDDADGDGVSGRIQWLDTPEGRVIGRFGWKGDAPTVERQVAGAFAGDMGLTSRLVTADDCTDAETECRAEASGGSPEVEDHILERVVTYAHSLAVPVRRAADDPEVLAGKHVFGDLGCAACHVPSHTTEDAALPELSGQLVWPYTDLLLHDMGEELADDRPLAEASGREWKTPPLWGLGLVDDVGGHTRFLHDGRARSLEEAILWHGGEAQDARDGFVGASAADRAALLAFLEDL